MNEMELLTRLREEVPLGEPSAQAEGALRTVIRAAGARAPAASRRLAGGRLTARRLTARRITARGTGPARPRGWRPGWRIAVAGGLGVTLGAGLLIAVAHPAGDSRPTAVVTVAELAQGAAAASDQPAYPAGQWFYVRERFAVPPTGIGPVGPADGTLTYWRTAGPAPEIRGPGVTSTKEDTYRPGRTKVWGQEAWLKNGRRTAGQFGTIPAGPGTITFQDLAKLPANPAALAGYLAARARSALGFGIELQFGPERYLFTGFNNHVDRQRTRSGLVFTSICQIFNEYVLPAHLVAELYQVLGALPGVRLDPHATDVAGRSGVAFTLAEGGGRIQLVVDPHDFRVLGINVIGAGWGKATIGDAFLRRVPVSGPWALP
jgi:hypothetical protein